MFCGPVLEQLMAKIPKPRAASTRVAPCKSTLHTQFAFHLKSRICRPLALLPGHLMMGWRQPWSITEEISHPEHQIISSSKLSDWPHTNRHEA